MKELGAIAALRNLVAFNTEVANELRAVFDDFRSTRMGQGFDVDGVENFLTDDVGRSSFAMYNKPGHPEFALQIEIQSSGKADISISQVGPEAAAGDPEFPLGFENGIAPDIAAAKVLGAILDLDRSSSFGKSFHRYIKTCLTGHEHSPSADFEGPAQG